MGYRVGEALVYQESETKEHRVEYVRQAEYVRGCSVVRPLGAGFPDLIYVQTSRLRSKAG